MKPFFNIRNKATDSYFDTIFLFSPAIDSHIYQIIDGSLIQPKAKNETLILTSIQPLRRLYVENPSYSVINFYQKSTGTNKMVNWYSDPNDAKSIHTGIHLDKFGFLNDKAVGGFYGYIPFLGFPFL